MLSFRDIRGGEFFRQWSAAGAERLLPVLAGAGALVSLAALGFAAGSLGGQWNAAEPVVIADSAPTDAVGGPEESVSSVILPAAVAAVAVVPAVAAAARTGLIEREIAAGHDPTRPVFWPVLGGWVSSDYGQRPDPFSGKAALHRGMDFAGLQNSTILAAGAGVISWSGPRAGYGNMIEINHGNGYISRYGHNASNLVARGDYVKAGQVIALMGDTGRATGTHLHFEILKDGRHVNPARLVQRGS